MKIHFDIPDRMWAELLAVAEEQQVPVASIVSEAVTETLRAHIGHLATVRRRREMRLRRARVIRLARAGHPDAEIARRTGELLNYVARVRRESEIKPTRRYAA